MNTLIIFIKYPEPGKVKTRLAHDIGESEAARIYSYMAEIIVKNTTDRKNYNTFIFYYPPGKETEIRNWFGNEEIEYFSQTGSTLGEKISNAFEKVFSMGVKKAVIIGSDCVDVGKETVNTAMGSLKNNDVVLGPAEDGGYYLLGLNRHRPEIFRDIEWSTGEVLNQTVENINNNNLSYSLLETLKDIDTVDDLKEANIDYSAIENTKP